MVSKWQVHLRAEDDARGRFVVQQRLSAANPLDAIKEVMLKFEIEPDTLNLVKVEPINEQPR